MTKPRYEHPSFGVDGLQLEGYVVANSLEPNDRFFHQGKWYTVVSREPGLRQHTVKIQVQGQDWPVMMTTHLRVRKK